MNGEGIVATAEQPVAFISGGSSGIGYGIAEALLGQGYAVTISARRPEKLEAAAEKLRELGDLHHVAANVASDEELGAALASHRERFGRLDVLVNNAGVGTAEPIDSVSPKTLDRQLGVNLRSYILATSMAMPMLRKSGRAHILNMSSVAGIRGRGGLAGYSASKAGVVAFTESLQEEIGGDGIKATAICPAFVDTPMVEWVVDSVGREKMIQVSDVVAVVTTLLALSPACNIPIVALEPPAGDLQAWGAADTLEAAQVAQSSIKG